MAGWIDCKIQGCSGYRQEITIKYYCTLIVGV